ncbi:ribosome small subunit-dependent GTPase A [Sediminicurvatus halobius]|uniref:Small ribosomal subunit biogenesis GTPase RsgA n=1 Tax=Sediminicurvatus halobius TaxID=2182432 RepID=A0A2U2N5M8_9GAMM|nr:ribosome small subunit-dependent GTPase A [Spiribacter halobius]PWG64269.1 ribosome small subunit-dependent GTPase A [Spiribacter halobius]UEX79393.1 ribosome small subunit-dependent GTPase A [Spiribacter halobius]
MNGEQAGLVVASFGSDCIVEAADGRLLRCHLRRRGGRSARPVCGDRVVWRESGGEGVVERIEPRVSVIERGDFRGRPRPLAANVTRLVVVLADPPGLDTRLLDRYLVLTHSLSLAALIFLNKADQLDTAGRARVTAALAPYEALGERILTGSAATGAGLAELRQALAEETVILVGQSGVGKSSLARALVPDLDVRTGTLSETSGQGRHTTSTTTLHPLPGGGCLIDSPGVRTLRLEHFPPEAITRGFPEITERAGQCRFRDCRHDREPGCAVRAALARGEIHPERLASWRSLLAKGGGA